MRLKKQITFCKEGIKMTIATIFLFFMYSYGCGEYKNSDYKRAESVAKITLDEKKALIETGQRKDLKIKKIFTLDTESAKFYGLNITKISYFDVDSGGNFIISDGKGIWRYDRKGDFVHEIGALGQGPGEFGAIEGLRCTSSNLISIYDPTNQKFILFYPNGKIEKEIRLRNIFTYKGVFLDNGFFLILKRKEMPTVGKRKFYYAVLDDQFNEVQSLEPSYSIDLFDRSLKFNLMDYSICFQIINDSIYIGSNVSRSIKIYIYDLTGNLRKIIEHKIKEKKLTEQDKQELLARWQKTPVWETIKFKHYFPRFFPSFKSFWTEKELGIFIEQYYKSDSPEECIIDWFDLEGIYINRLSLPKAMIRKFQNGYMYCVNEKESGFYKIDVFTISIM